MRIHRIRRIGNSNMLALPKEFERSGFTIGADILIRENADGTATLAPAGQIFSPPRRVAPDPQPSLLSSLRRQRREVVELVERHGFTDVRIFGSVARGTERGNSDLDILVRMSEPLKGLDYFARIDELRMSLEKLLGRTVDLVDEGSLSDDRFGSRVLADAVAL